MSSWILWAAMLLVQNASFTWVSRARNSGSIAYHGIAAIFSNGVYFINLIVAVDKIGGARAAHDTVLLIETAVFYTVFTVIGSVGMHWLLMHKVENRSEKLQPRSVLR